MSVTEQSPRCKFCSSAMHITRFQSSVTQTGIDRELVYECLWCGETDKVTSHVRHMTKEESAASPTR